MSTDENIKEREGILLRSSLLYIIVLLVAAAIIFRLLQVMFFQKERWEKVAEEYSINLKEGNPERGDIFDEKGNVLSTTVYYYKIFMDTRAKGLSNLRFDEGIDSLSGSLARLFKDKTKQEYYDYISKARADSARYLPIAANCDYREVEALVNFPIFKYGPNGGGFIKIKEGTRIRPLGNLMRRTLGIVKPETENSPAVGTTELEFTYNSELTGTLGKALKRKISKGVWINVSGGEIVKTKEGLSLITSIDIDLQDYVNEVLKKQILKFKANHGSVVVMEVKTGNIKAIANLTMQEDSTAFEDQNYAVVESLAPGSTFKLPILLAALEDGFVDLNDTIDTGHGYVKYFDKEILDEGAYGKIPVWKVFAKSSNVGMAKIVYENYYKKKKVHLLLNRLISFGLSDYSDIDINGETYPMIKDKTSNWSKVTPMMMSHGYEVKLTPIQILTFYNAIANNGKLIKPSIVKALKRHGETVKVFDNKEVKTICSQKNLKKVRFVLEAVMKKGGTAANIKTKGYSIAGKTGTAKYWDHEQKKFLDINRTSFVGYFPASKPKYSIIVVINRPPGKNKFGSNVAAPVFKQISDKIFSQDYELNPPKIKDLGSLHYVDIPVSKNGYLKDLDYVFSSILVQTENKSNKNSPWVFTCTHKNSVEYKNLNLHKNIVPTVTYMAANDAIYLLESMGLKVEIIGRGFVSTQSLKPGVKFKDGDKIKLKLV